MKKSLKTNSLFFKILCVVVVGVICVSVSISYIIINISKGIFTDTYSDSQKKIFGQVNEKIYDFHGELVKVINSVNSHRAFKTYFTEENLEVEEMSQTIFDLKRQMKSALATNTYDIGVLILGLNGSSFLNRSELLTIRPNEILSMDISKNSLVKSDTILYQYLENGFTSSTKDEPVIVVTKTLNLTDGEPYGIIYFTIKEKDFEKFYDYFTLEINDVVLLNENNVVLSSNKKENIGQVQEEFRKSIEDLVLKEELSKSYNSNKNTILIQRLPYCNLTICGTVDNYKAIGKMYDVGNILLICFVITLCILIGIFLIVRQMTKPLYLLTEKMSNVRAGNFDEYIEVSGPEEVKELSSTFNYMIKDLNKYINELVKVQKEKRAAEIHALQMQINPHYIFNTLSSFKWLIWQGNNDKSLSALDSFINLLRNTISKTDEFITIEDEIENIKNYVFINNIRYGDRIKVEYFIMPDCNDYLVPKLILQPFIENSFFHGFPSDEEGKIQVFIREQGENIKIEIYDNGVGIEEETLEKVKQKKETKNDHFSGIGVNNVDSRIKLIYGNEYGIEIKSKLNKGTTVTILLPIKK
ncbi:histidine kinase [Clostridium sp.]|uniref:sensor histidine kinase n=1 Tax=Clostridium sp. TaxID=1506 RepID=UPI0025C54018|nr:histidine kinase [Clostridium sp.]